MVWNIFLIAQKSLLISWSKSCMYSIIKINGNWLLSREEKYQKEIAWFLQRTKSFLNVKILSECKKKRRKIGICNFSKWNKTSFNTLFTNFTFTAFVNSLSIPSHFHSFPLPFLSTWIPFLSTSILFQFHFTHTNTYPCPSLSSWFHSKNFRIFQVEICGDKKKGMKEDWMEGRKMGSKYRKEERMRGRSKVKKCGMRMLSNLFPTIDMEQCDATISPQIELFTSGGHFWYFFQIKNRLFWKKKFPSDFIRFFFSLFPLSVFFILFVLT